MAYVTYADYKAYRALENDDEQTLITAIIARAQGWIDLYTGRTFEAAADSTRYFTVGKDTDGRYLFPDKDLAAITTVKTNLDNGSGGVTIPSTDYVTDPANDGPYWCVEILPSNSGNYTWTYTNNPQKAISITGKWAYSATAPAPIVQACLRLTGFIYSQIDAQIFETTAQPDQGTITIPHAIPRDVTAILDQYRRVI